MFSAADWSQQTSDGDIWCLNQVSAASVVQQNAAALFDCEAPELFCGRRHFSLSFNLFAIFCVKLSGKCSEVISFSVRCSEVEYEAAACYQPYRVWPGYSYLLKVVDHEEDVGVAHLGLLSFTVHGVFTGRGEHFLWNVADRRNEAWTCWADLRAAPGPESYLTFLLVDVDVSCIWARADGTRHHVVQLEDRTGFRLSSVNQQPESCVFLSVSLTFCRMRFR